MKKCNFCKKPQEEKYCSWECRALNEISKNFARPQEDRWQKWIIHPKIPIHKQPAWIKCVYREHDDKRWKVVNHHGGKCRLCGFDRIINTCHLIPSRFGGKLTNENIIILCPNHHWCLDHELLSEDEKKNFIKILEEEYEYGREILHFLDIKTYELPIKDKFDTNH